MGSVDIDRMMSSPWYAKPNDLIGGWCVMDVDLTPGQADQMEFAKGAKEFILHEIGDFLTKEMAQHVADLHNAWLKSKEVSSEL